MLPLILLQHPAPPPMPPPPPPGLPHAGPPLHLLAEELGLSEAQQAKLKAIHRAHRDALEAAHEALGKAHRALMDAVRDGGDLTALHGAFSKAHLAALTEAKALHAEVNAVLTPDQQAKARALHPAPAGGPQGPGQGPGRGMRREGPGGPGSGPGMGPGPGGPPPRGEAE